jgi:LacI family transcriptional regulator
MSTVSRVINNSEYPVSEHARQRVLKAVDELNYLPNRSAQQLRRTFNDVIGLIVRDISDNYFGEIAKGVTEKAMELGYLSFVCNTGREPQNELKLHELLWQHRVRGIILAGGGMNTPEYRSMLERQISRFAEYGLQLVSLAPQGMPVRSVTVDYVEVARLITSFLLARGHRSIALVTGRKDVTTCQQHQTGFQRALDDAGLHEAHRRIYYGDFTEEEGYRNTVQLLATGVEFTAVFCGSDSIAIGVLQALHHRNLRVPEDVSVMGIGDLPQSRYSNPPLTTVRIPRYEMGARAVELAVGRVQAEEDIWFHPSIVERGSIRDVRPRDQEARL